ncbi:hypothetical protein BDV30DRAFT_201909 [Aspergillus minisclerotigenes]|uniref:Uncharacterized protein n=1 Tax=Aspergillus minisclerotigenes TaxID=656917 RepID=A0A5N6JP93_9EURO|nr:hypothetical protein BDV30DRAFT_201909 [Aspergillus minisclerotigenes]
MVVVKVVVMISSRYRLTFTNPIISSSPQYPMMGRNIPVGYPSSHTCRPGSVSPPPPITGLQCYDSIP